MTHPDKPTAAQPVTVWRNTIRPSLWDSSGLVKTDQEYRALPVADFDALLAALAQAVVEAPHGELISGKRFVIRTEAIDAALDALASEDAMAPEVEMANDDGATLDDQHRVRT